MVTEKLKIALLTLKPCLNTPETRSMVGQAPIKGTVTDLLVPAYPAHCPTPLTPPLFLWPDIGLSKLWLLGNYSKVPTTLNAVQYIPNCHESKESPASIDYLRVLSLNIHSLFT